MSKNLPTTVSGTFFTEKPTFSEGPFTSQGSSRERNALGTPTLNLSVLPPHFGRNAPRRRTFSIGTVTAILQCRWLADQLQS